MHDAALDGPPRVQAALFEDAQHRVILGENIVENNIYQSVGDFKRQKSGAKLRRQKSGVRIQNE